MKQYYCFLERFNNYFNRKIIMFSSLSDYEDNSDDYFIPVDEHGAMLPFDFNPNDNVMTEIIANDVPFTPDYFLLMDEDQNIVSRWFILEEKRNRQGQWIYTLRRDVISDHFGSLYDAPIFVERGMLSEDDPFIVNDEGMSLNQIKKNEIALLDKSKSSWIIGYMAKNIGGSDVNVQTSTETLNINFKTIGDIAEAIGTEVGVLENLINIGDDTSNRAYFTYAVNIGLFTYFPSYALNIRYNPYVFTFNSDFDGGFATVGSGQQNEAPYVFVCGAEGGKPSDLPDFFIPAVVANKTSLKSQIKDILNKPYYLTNAQLELLKAFKGTYIKYNGEFYKLDVNEIGTTTSSRTLIKNDNTYSSLTDIANDTAIMAQGTMDLFAISYQAGSSVVGLYNGILASEKIVTISLKYVSASDVVPQLDTVISSGRNTTSDQEYDIFAIPLNLYIEENGNTFETIESYSRRIASAIGIQQDAKIYDLQLMPYCPLPDLISDENKIDITDLTEHQNFDYIYKNISDTVAQDIIRSMITFTHVSGDDYTGTVTKTLSLLPVGENPNILDIVFYDLPEGATVSNVSYSINDEDITINFDYNGSDPNVSDLGIFVYYNYPDTDVPCGIIFYVSNSSFSTIIEENISSDKSKKVLSNCYLWRLVSPNYQGAFDFNIAKNGGTVDSFNVFCTYKPFTPLIKVAPNFNWLYGIEFQDNRGLICAGDFSLPRASDAWETYQLQNKNYQNIFNRDIQHLDFMQSIEMRNQVISGAVGILTDSAKGVGAGAMVGGGYGALIGGALGATVSAVGYAIDTDTLARTQRENKQLAIDKFNYQLGNIKALPYTLTKVGSFDAISKIFPIVEEYSCSDKELEAFENKIKYESMIVMRIGTLREFANFNDELNYFKGRLIRNDGIAEDPHTLNAIYEELLKGVYI